MGRNLAIRHHNLAQQKESQSRGILGGLHSFPAQWILHQVLDTFTQISGT